MTLRSHLEDHQVRVPHLYRSPITGRWERNRPAAPVALAVAFAVTALVVIREGDLRFGNHDGWFLSEVEKGIEAADCGDLIDHQTVRERIDRRDSAWCRRAGQHRLSAT